MSNDKTLKEQINNFQLSDTFSDSILDDSNNVICYLEPVFSEQNQVRDFKFLYVNNRLEEIADQKSSDIIGKTLLEFYPPNISNGVMDLLSECYDSGLSVDYEREFIINNRSFWFNNRAIRLSKGLILYSKNVSREKRIEKQLILHNKLFLKAEQVANMGNLTWNLESGEVNLTDNVYNILERKDDFEPSLKSLLHLVYYEDLKQVLTGIKVSIYNHRNFDQTFRVKTKSGIKHLKVLGESFISEKQHYFIAVLRDVSQQIVKETALQQRNEELHRTNHELEAFNRIASHDLQEPLRKVQMFISRFIEEQKGQFNTKSQQYLDKTVESIHRMRNLISNLLSYSGIDDKAHSKEIISLNEVLENVKDDFSEKIEETNAEIVADNLPKIKGVTFQMEQVFSNLIANSLKYIKPNKAPKIKISSKKIIIEKGDALGDKLSPGMYTKLTFADNGIGFEPKHKHKVFELFQRLHGKTEYKGTGLGLAICKKIIEAHNGFILADSQPNQGTTFTVYLPN